MVIIFGEFSKFRDFCTISSTFPILQKVLENLLELKIIQNRHFLHFGKTVGDALIEKPLIFSILKKLMKML